MAAQGFGIGGFGGLQEPFGSAELQAASASAAPTVPAHEVTNTEPRIGGSITGDAGDVFIIQLSSDQSSLSGVAGRTKTGVPEAVRAQVTKEEPS